MKKDRLRGFSHVPRAVGPKHGSLEREADRLAARALGGRPLPRWEPSGTATPGDASAGRPLDPRTREFFEGRFGHDFGRVRVHAGEPAAASARELDAEAFTVGRDVFVRDARDASLGAGDPQVLAHELAHVVQVGEGRAPASLVQRKVDPNAPRGPGAADYADTFRAYLLYLHSMKKAQGPQPAFNPYIVPTIDEVLYAITVSPEFRDKVRDAYQRMFDRDIVNDIVRYSTPEELDHLMRPFISGPGDFPEPSKDKAVA
jgi:hypothetical protein